MRSQSDEALLAHVDSAGDLYPTLSVSILVPQKSVLRLGRREKRLASGPPPESTPNPKVNLVWTIAGRAKQRATTWRNGWRSGSCSCGTSTGKAACRGLRSGNTFIDERNFALDKSKRGADIAIGI